MTGTEYDHRAPSTEESSAGKINNERANLRTAVPITGSDGIEQHRERFENCGECVFFLKPNVCQIVEGPVQPSQVCDWIQGREGEGDDEDKKFDIDDIQAFAWALMKRQAYTHKVINVEFTPVGWLLLIEDGQDPPHRFSLSWNFTRDHLSLEHHFTQEEADRLVREGKIMNFKPPTSFREAEELFGQGQIGLEEFEKFKRAREAEESN